MSSAAQALVNRIGAFICVLVSVCAPGIAATQRSPDTTLVVTTDWLARHLDDPSVVLLAVDRNREAYARVHVRGARYVDYQSLVATVNGISTELPGADSLAHLFGSVGVSSASHVVVMAAALPMATRTFVALEYAGVRHASLLDGGMTRWRAEQRPETNVVPEVSAVRMTPAVNGEIIASADWVRHEIGAPGVALIDSRSDAEYDGTAQRPGPVSTGHLPGARHLQWPQLTSPADDLELRSPAELRRLYAERVAPGDTVVTYCASGYRASVTYFVARYLGYPAKLFDGSYEEWSRLGYPTDTVPAPLRRQ